MAREYHPDRVPEHLTKLRGDAEDKFKQVQAAWAVLSDPAKRRQYDNLGHTPDIPIYPPPTQPMRRPRRVSFRRHQADWQQAVIDRHRPYRLSIEDGVVRLHRQINQRQHPPVLHNDTPLPQPYEKQVSEQNQRDLPLDAESQA